MTAPFDPAAHPPLADLAARLRELAGDSAYQAGRDYLRKGLVRQTAVAATTAYATVAGSTDYRVSIAFADTLKPTCTCPAHRRNTFCKHVVAVCTALLDRPADFTPADLRPEPEKKPRKKRTATSHPGDPAHAPTPPPSHAPTLRAAGLEVVDRLLADLTDGGLASLGPDKAALLESAGELVRSLKLRRLGNHIPALQRANDPPDSNRRWYNTDGLELPGFAETLVGAYLARQATAAHLDGRVALDPRLAEDLLGKTWRDSELEPVAGLELVEVGFSRTDDGEFRIETSYLADLPTGQLYAERAITPLRFHQPPKPRHRLRLLVDDAGLYPGVSPRRLKLRRVRRAPLDATHVERLVQTAPADLAELRRRLVERQQLPFGPFEAPTLFRPAALLRQDRRVGALDAAGRFLELAWPEVWLTGAPSLPSLLPPSGHYALFGLLTLADEGLSLLCLSALGSFDWPDGPYFPARDAS